MKGQRKGNGSSLLKITKFMLQFVTFNLMITKKIFIPAIVLILFTTLAFTSKIDGNWKVTAKENGDGDPFYVTLRLKTEGEKVSGVLVSDFGTFDILEGTFNGKELEFTWLMEFITPDNQPGALEIKQKGRLENDDLLIFYRGGS
ncbi:hypothetical protein ES705_49943 [subsurface metagenome]